MPPPLAAFSQREVELGEVGIVEQPVVERVHGRQHVELVLRQLLDEAGDIARIGDEQAACRRCACRAGSTPSARRCDRAAARVTIVMLLDLLALLERRLQPRFVLQHVGDDVAMPERCALGHARRAARCTAGRRRRPASRSGLLSCMRRPAAIASLNLMAPGSEKAGTIFFTLRTTRLTIAPFGKPEQVAHAGDARCA